jgi:hypothetical protein
MKCEEPVVSTMRKNLSRLSIVAGALLVCGIGFSAEEPPGAAGPSPFPDAPPALVSGVENLLEEGFKVGPRQLPLVKKKFEAARSLSADDDPRLDYAYGLVLVRQSQNKAALVPLEAAVNRNGPAYWPAWQALIWVQLVDRQYDKGLNRLDEFARRVGQTAEGDPISDSQRDAARWMGEILEALDLTVAGKKFHDTIVEHDATIRDALGDELSEVLDTGREIVHERDLEFTQKAGQSRDEAQKKLARRRKGQKGKFDSDLVDLDKEKENNARSADEWKKWLDETLEKVDKQLGQLEKEYQFQQKRAESLQQSILVTGKEMTLLNVQMSLVGGQQTGSGLFQMQFGRMQQQLILRQNQLMNYQLEYNATIGRMTQTAQQGQGVQQERAAMVRKYEKATGDLVKKNAELDRWAARVAEKKKKLDVQGVSKQKGARAAADRRIPTLKSYVPLDLDAERARLLEAYGVQAVNPATEAAAAPEN